MRPLLNLASHVHPVSCTRHLKSQPARVLGSGAAGRVLSADPRHAACSACLQEILKRVLPARLHPRLAYLSGPSFAAEVAKEIPTAVTVAAEDDGVAQRVQVGPGEGGGGGAAAWPGGCPAGADRHGALVVKQS